MENFAADSRVWIYQSDRFLTEQEQQLILDKGKAFIADWTSHGKFMKAELTQRYGLFLVLIVDETQANASGCGIDKSVHFFQQLEREMNLNLMNRLKVAYRQGDELKLTSLSNFEKLIEEGSVNEHTVVYNNLISSLNELANSWEVPLSKSWHAKLLPAKSS